MSAKPAWQDTLSYTLVADPHVTGMHGFEVLGDNAVDEGVIIFESGLAYTSERDATQAAEDCCYLAWSYRCWHEPAT